MSNYPNVAAEAGDKFLAMLADGQDRFVEYVRSTREMMPQIPPQFAAQTPAMPFAFPSARDVADAQFEFVSKMLKQQEGFLKQLYSVSAPAKKAKPAARSATKSAGAKSRSTARRSTNKSRSSR